MTHAWQDFPSLSNHAFLSNKPQHSYYSLCSRHTAVYILVSTGGKTPLSLPLSLKRESLVGAVLKAVGDKVSHIEWCLKFGANGNLRLRSRCSSWSGHQSQHHTCYDTGWESAVFFVGVILCNVHLGRGQGNTSMQTRMMDRSPGSQSTYGH